MERRRAGGPYGPSLSPRASLSRACCGKAGAAGMYMLRFDYKLRNAQNGASYNGAKVYMDQFYASAPGVTPVVVPNLVFVQTYAAELFDFRLNQAELNKWSLAQTVSLELTAGQHTLYLSSVTGDSINQYGASVWFDNVSLVSAGVSPVLEPGSAALLSLGLLASAAWARQSARQVPARPA